MKRITLLASSRLIALLIGVCLGHNAWCQSGPAQPATKEAALRTVLQQAIVPAYQDLAAKCHDLTEALASIDQASATGNLEPAQKAWVAALLAARRVQWFQSGPIADREYLSSFYYSKVLPQRMDAVLNSSRAIDESFVAEFGPNAKGLFALEYLLFQKDPKKAEPVPRRIQYALLLARDLEKKAGQVAQDWGAAGDQGTAAKFLAGGQQSLSLVVNHLAQSLEQTGERINFVLVLPQPIARQLDRIEDSRSATTQQSVLALLQAASTVYHGTNGAGLEEYLRHLNASLAARLNAQFESALSGVQAIGGPLEQAAVDKRPLLQAAYEKTHALEILFKVDVASALGVTLTFSSNDGD
jgi:predicted lipoprotein